MEGVMTRWTTKAVLLTVIVWIPLCCVSATNYTVGGSTGWDLSSNVQAWAATISFHVGDTLVFRYTPLHTVLEVNHLEYNECRTVNPISAHSSGDTVVPLTEPGTRYFICGRSGYCAMGLKLRVDVLPPNDADVTGSRRSPRRPSRPHPPNPPSSPGKPGPPTPPSSPLKPDPPFEIPLPPDSSETNPAPGPQSRCNSAVGGMISDWFSYHWWVPLASSLLALHSPLQRLGSD